MTTKGFDWTTSISRLVGVLALAIAALYWLNNLEAKIELSDMKIQYHSTEIAAIQSSVQELNTTLVAIDKKLGILIDRYERPNKQQ
jgi:hypothetical protein